MVEDPRATAGAGRVRPLNRPQPLVVEADSLGQPAAILQRGVMRPVRVLHDTWRIDDEWWRQEISRRYWDVELEGGRRLTLYRDLVTGDWYEQRYTPAR